MKIDQLAVNTIRFLSADVNFTCTGLESKVSVVVSLPDLSTITTEAVKAFLPLMAKRVGIEEVYGIRLLENVSSGRVLEKCGFETFFEGEGEYHDGVYEISKSVWKL